MEKKKHEKERICIMYNDEHNIQIRCTVRFKGSWEKRGFKEISVFYTAKENVLSELAK